MLAGPNEQCTIGSELHLDPNLQQGSIHHGTGTAASVVVIIITIIVKYHPCTAQSQYKLIKGHVGRLGTLGHLKQSIVHGLQRPPDHISPDVTLAPSKKGLDFALPPSRCGGRIECGSMVERIQITNESLVRSHLLLGGPRLQIGPHHRTVDGRWFLGPDSGQAKPARRYGWFATSTAPRCRGGPCRHFPFATRLLLTTTTTTSSCSGSWFPRYGHTAVFAPALSTRGATAATATSAISCGVERKGRGGKQRRRPSIATRR
mmetsp:Transcript_38074/g.77488  ORF Transcript_38074/g.77488 Transcript_38074/m.77488 type:complete len:261 (+) Transcript_38074:3184-3966(+)